MAALTSYQRSGLLEITTVKYVQYEPITWQPGGRVQLDFYTTNPPPCRIQSSSNLTAWDDLATLTPDVNHLVRYTDTNSPAFPYRFYRMLCP